MTRYRILFIVASLLINLLLGNAIAQNNVIKYTTNNDAIIMPSNMKAFDATIVDNEYKNGIGYITFDKDIKAIGERAFNNCWGITSIILPETIDTIGNNAFQNCSRLTTITLPDSIIYIGKNAFLNCKRLKFDISWLQNTKEIEGYAFAHCDSIFGDISSLAESTKIQEFAFADTPIVSAKEHKEEAKPLQFRFLTWNIEGYNWKKNYQVEEVDSVVEHKGIKQMIAKYQPRIYTLNEVPYYLSKDFSPKSSGIKLICGPEEDKVHTAFCIKSIANAIVTEDTFIDREDLTHSKNDRYEKRHFGLATQYLNGKEVAVVSVHFTPTFREKEKNFFESLRISQAQDVISAVNRYDYAIVAGDLNTSDPAISQLFKDAGFEEVVVKRWFVDHIFIKGLKALGCGADNTDLKLSDHPLLWADLLIE